MISRQIMRQLLLVEDFPTLPEVMNEILEATDREDISAEELTSVIERDHAISIRILRLANSAFYGLRNPVDTMRTAVVVLGFESVRLLALATSVFDTLSRQRQFALNPKDFWMHSLGAAKAAQLLARRCASADAHDVCFTAGLIHDIGKYALAIALKEQYHAVIEAGKHRRCPLREIELELLGCASSEVGGWLAEKWKLPSNIVTLITYHWRPLSYSGAAHREVAIVALADQISCIAGFGVAGEYGEVAPDANLVSALGLGEEEVSDLVETMTSHVEETRRFIGLMAKPAVTAKDN